MQAFLVSAAVVALAEFGDKTQLLALVLGTRYRRPIPVILGIFVATVFNHALAGAVGAWVARMVGPERLRIFLALSFIAMAVWTLIPDKLGAAKTSTPRLGIFGSTLVAFFLVEMGDKTQIATAALAAKYGTLLPVIAGTTLGLLLVDIPTVLLGDQIARRMPLRAVRITSAAIYLGLGVLLLIQPG